MTSHLYGEMNGLFQKGKLYDPLKDMKDKNLLIKSLRGLKGFSKQHIDSFNECINVRLKEIVTSKMNRRVTCQADTSFFLEYLDIEVGKPTYEKSYTKYGMASELYPNECRLGNMTYAADIYVRIRYMVNGVVQERSGVNIGRFPIMLGSDNCYLCGKGEKELALLKECPIDPKGYFIINGTEKVILIQEQLIENRIIVEKNSKLDTILAGVASYTLDTKSVCGMLVKNGKIYVKSGSFKEILPLFVIFKAFGIQCEQEVFQLIDCDREMNELLVLSLEDAHSKGVRTSDEALEYLGTKLKEKKYQVKRERDLKEQAREVLANILLSHIPVTNYDFYPKTIFLALMVKRLIEGLRDPSKLDNRDYYGNKRMKCAGNLLELMFEDKFKNMNTSLKASLNKQILKMKSTKNTDITHLFDPLKDIITNGLQKAIGTGNWIIKRFNMERKGVSQLLNRISYISALGMMTRLTSQFQKTRKIAGPRALLGSHWGMICPCDTPDGQGCGLVKNLALTTCITTNPKISTLKVSNLPVQDYAIVGNKGHRVTLNGSIIGYTLTEDIIYRLRLMRRKGLISQYVNVALVKSDGQQFGEIMINMDSGRLIRPLLIVEKGKILLTDEMVSELRQGRLRFEDLLKKGVIEFLDVNEEDNCLIALRPENIIAQTTHVEIDPMTILGCVSGLIPFPNHNQSPRNIYQCSMGKQAQGITAYNQLHRLDTVNYLLVYPQKPLMKTSHIQLIHYEKLPAGHNASVAVMSYSGYDIEDAVMVNKASLDRGFGRSMYYRRYETKLEKKNNYMFDRLANPEMEQQMEVARTGRKKATISKKFHALDMDGLAKIGALLTSGDVYVNKKVPIIPPQFEIKNINDIKFRDEPTSHKGNKPLFVDRTVLSYNGTDTINIKTILREMRRPELGDKFSSRHGQKGVCGLMINQEDMPFSQKGWRPDLIMNPHGYPSRMTVGKLMELVGSKAGALEGKQKYGTAFGGDKIEDLGKILLNNGFSYTGKDVLISGITGQYISCYVFCGPIFYQRLKHMVTDKIHARPKGRVTVLTRQPTEGRSKEGGLRLGEMERDSLLGFGASDLLLERLLISSDIYNINVCEKCGMFQSSNHCSSCKTDKVYKITLPYSCKLLFQELLSMGIKPKINLCKIDKNPYDYDQY